MTNARKGEKRPDEIKEGFKTIEDRGIFTASDLYQLRCAVIHAGSSVIEEGAKRIAPTKPSGFAYRAMRAG